LAELKELRFIENALNQLRIDVTKGLATLDTKVKGHEEDLKELKTLVTNHLVHRLPAWILVVMSVLTAIIGVAIGRIF
jgi:hypothetical protein